METRTRYCFDIDGVVANFHDAFAKLLNEHGGRVPVGHIPAEWNWFYRFGTHEQVQSAWEYIRRNPRWWTRLEPFIDDTAKIELAEISEKADVVFVTARSLCPGSITQEWVNDHVGDFSVIAVDSWQEKLPILNALRPSLYMDDHIDTLNAVAVKGCTLIAAALPYTAPSRYPRLEVNEVIRSIRDEY